MHTVRVLSPEGRFISLAPPPLPSEDATVQDWGAAWPWGQARHGLCGRDFRPWVSAPGYLSTHRPWTQEEKDRAAVGRGQPPALALTKPFASTHAPATAASPGPGPAPGPPPSSGIPQPQPGASVLSLPPTHHLNLPAANAAANPCCCKGITMQPGCILAHVCECAHTHVCTEEGA